MHDTQLCQIQYPDIWSWCLVTFPSLPHPHVKKTRKKVTYLRHQFRTKHEIFMMLISFPKIPRKGTQILIIVICYPPSTGKMTKESYFQHPSWIQEHPKGTKHCSLAWYTQPMYRKCKASGHWEHRNNCWLLSHFARLLVLKSHWKNITFTEFSFFKTYQTDMITGVYVTTAI